jgi:hypothetical protein
MHCSIITDVLFLIVFGKPIGRWWITRRESRNDHLNRR